MTKSNFKKSYDVISVTSPPLRHQNNVTKFFQFEPSQSKFLAIRQCWWDWLCYAYWFDIRLNVFK